MAKDGGATVVCTEASLYYWSKYIGLSFVASRPNDSGGCQLTRHKIVLYFAQENYNNLHVVLLVYTCVDLAQATG
jgi:hypothetical protein